MDDTYQAYVNRAARLTLLETYKSQVDHIQESPKFKPHPAGGREPVAFPGYSVMTPPWSEDEHNRIFYENLEKCQQQLVEKLPAHLIVPVPAKSFHLTLADLIWDSAYLDATKNPEFDGQLRLRIAECFASYRAMLTKEAPIRWMVLGLMVRTRAIGVCLAPTDENSYKQILELRRSIYQNPDLIALGIEQQYHFTAHITLGYFGEVRSELLEESEAGEAMRDQFCSLLSEYNDQWLDAPQELAIKRVELRKFDDMTRYRREEDWPAVEY